MIERLNGKQVEAFSKALMSAYPDFSRLRRFIRINFDENLNSIVNKNRLSEVVYDLIIEFESNGEIEALINAVQEDKPNNPRVKAFIKSLKEQPQKKEEIKQEAELDWWQQVKDWLDKNELSKVFEALDEIYPKMDNEKSIYNQFKKEFQRNRIGINYEERLAVFINSLKRKLDK